MRGDLLWQRRGTWSRLEVQRPELIEADHSCLAGVGQLV